MGSTWRQGITMSMTSLYFGLRLGLVYGADIFYKANTDASPID